MSRLPTVGGDTDAWGTVLNDYLTESAHVAVLSSSPSAGATTFDLAVIPASLKIGSIIAIDSYTTECELRSVSNIVGATVTVTQGNGLAAGLKYAHASGDTVVVLNDLEVSPSHFALPGGTSDNWSGFQRMVTEAWGLAVKVKHIAALVGATWQVSMPICVPTSSQWENIGLRTRSGFSPTSDFAGALCMVSNRCWAFTATASDNTFTVAGGHAMGGPGSYSEVNHTKIVFNAPYGETLPGGITPGKVYYIDTTPTTSTFTVSATQGGAILDVTSDGGGFAWESIDELSRVYWDNVRFDCVVADVCGLRMSLQQPGYIDNIRFQMDATPTAVDTVVGFAITGQVAHINNVVMGINPKVTGMTVGGSGILIRGFNVNGNNNLDTGIVVNAWSSSIQDLWTEQCGVCGVKITGGRGLVFGGSWMHSGGSATSPAIIVDTGSDVTASYECGPIYMSSGSGREVIRDVQRGLSIYSPATSGHESEQGTDYAGVFPGWSSLGNAYGTAFRPAPTFRTRLQEGFSVGFQGTPFRVKPIDEMVYGDSSAGDVTMNLHPVAGWIGHTVRLAHVGTGNNSCTVDTLDSALIDGQASITIPKNTTIELQVNESGNWITRSGSVTTLQAYAPTNVSTDRSYDADTVVVAELADVVGTLIADLQARKVIG